MAPREEEDPGSVIRVHIMDFGAMLAKMEERGRFLFQAGLLNSSQLHVKSSHNELNSFWVLGRILSWVWFRENGKFNKRRAVTVEHRGRPGISWFSVLKHKTEKGFWKLTSYCNKKKKKEEKKPKSLGVETKVIGSRGKRKESGLNGRFIRDHALHQSQR